MSKPDIRVTHVMTITGDGAFPVGTFPATWQGHNLMVQDADGKSFKLATNVRMDGNQPSRMSVTRTKDGEFQVAEASPPKKRAKK